jgi:hypothetical protein
VEAEAGAAAGVEDPNNVFNHPREDSFKVEGVLLFPNIPNIFQDISI